MDMDIMVITWDTVWVILRTTTGNETPTLCETLCNTPYHTPDTHRHYAKHTGNMRDTSYPHWTQQTYNLETGSQSETDPVSPNITIFSAQSNFLAFAETFLIFLFSS